MELDLPRAAWRSFAPQPLANGEKKVACHLNGDPFPRRSVASATTICPLCCAKQTPGPPGVLGLLWALFGQLEFASLGFLH